MTRRILTALFAASLALVPTPADACGGTFCDGGPKAMPVNQKGENIVFVRDGANVEAHIQIQYDGKDAMRFAWLVPLQTDPISIGVGSQQLFTNLLAGTVPQYLTTTVNDCPSPPSCGFASGTGAGGGSAGPGSGAAGSGGSSTGGPVVTFKATVGAFDVVVLKGGTADEVVKWLSDNQYQQNPAATPVIADYLSHGFLFVAIKLTGGVGVDEIHPLVIKYAGDSPCIPLKLTAIAATENMGVRPFFFGSERWVPTNYKHVLLNETRVNFQMAAAAYDDAVTHAVDSPVAAGHAFVTEYAGSSSVVPTNGIYDQAWVSAPFATVDPTKVVSQLASEGLAFCGGSTCTFNHPLVLGILHEFLPVPTGVPEGTFYSCLSCYAKLIDLTKWDGQKLADAIETRIVQPGKRAADILAKHPYLTRMYTTISPSEMTEDPEFHEHPGLPSVGRTITGANHLTCSESGFDIGSRSFALQGGSWPQWPAEMPWAETIEQYSPGFPPVGLVDNKAAIDAAVGQWNAAHGWPVPPTTPPPMPPCNYGQGGAGGSSSGAVGGAPGAGGAAEFAPGSGTGSEPSGGCSTSSRASSPFAWLSLSIVALALAARRRHLTPAEDSHHAQRKPTVPRSPRRRCAVHCRALARARLWGHVLRRTEASAADADARQSEGREHPVRPRRRRGRSAHPDSIRRPERHPFRVDRPPAVGPDLDRRRLPAPLRQPARCHGAAVPGDDPERLSRGAPVLQREGWRRGLRVGVDGRHERGRG
jgi:hypothetical protein